MMYYCKENLSYVPIFLSAQTNPISPNNPTIVRAAAVKAPEMAEAKVSVAMTRITTTARVTVTSGLDIISLMVLPNNIPLLLNSI